jgi:hypothetical protein
VAVMVTIGGNRNPTGARRTTTGDIARSVLVSRAIRAQDDRLKSLRNLNGRARD